jgi:hypothetical protein
MRDRTQPRDALIGDEPFRLTDDSTNYAQQIL